MYMNKNLSSDNRGIAHVALIAVIVVVVGAIGFAAYRVANKDKDSSSSVDSSTQKAAEADCKKEIDDKDVCKFLSSWDVSKQYRMVTTDPKGAKSTFEIDGDNSRISMNMEAGSYEVITIGKVTYTKAGDVWYKQTIKDPEQDVAKDYKADFEEPSKDKPEASKTTYTKIGKEACGNLQCFKYQVNEPEAKDEKQFIWFDDEDYKIRRSRTETAEGATEITFEYSNVSVKEPSPVKELGPNQYIVPGQTEPMTMPTAP
jgi:outer membrane lipoprotein-sorting protein